MWSNLHPVQNSQDLGKSHELLWSFSQEPWRNHIPVQILRNHERNLWTYPNMHVYKIDIPSEHVFEHVHPSFRLLEIWAILAWFGDISNVVSVITWKIYVILIKYKADSIISETKEQYGNSWGFQIEVLESFQNLVGKWFTLVRGLDIFRLPLLSKYRTVARRSWFLNIKLKSKMNYMIITISF